MADLNSLILASSNVLNPAKYYMQGEADRRAEMLNQLQLQRIQNELDPNSPQNLLAHWKVKQIQNELDSNSPENKAKRFKEQQEAFLRYLNALKTLNQLDEQQRKRVEDNLKLFGGFLSKVHDEDSWQDFRKMVSAHGASTSLFPEHYDPDWVKRETQFYNLLMNRNNKPFTPGTVITPEGEAVYPIINNGQVTYVKLHGVPPSVYNQEHRSESESSGSWKNVGFIRTNDNKWHLMLFNPSTGEITYKAIKGTPEVAITHMERGVRLDQSEKRLAQKEEQLNLSRIRLELSMKKDERERVEFIQRTIVKPRFDYLTKQQQSLSNIEELLATRDKLVAIGQNTSAVDKIINQALSTIANTGVRAEAEIRRFAPPEVGDWFTRLKGFLSQKVTGTYSPSQIDQIKSLVSGMHEVMDAMRAAAIVDSLKTMKALGVSEKEALMAVGISKNDIPWVRKGNRLVPAVKW